MSTTPGSDDVASATSVEAQSGLAEVVKPAQVAGVATRMARDESSMGSIGTGEDTDLNLPPGRMHAVKGQHRLQGSGSNIMSLLLHARTTGNDTPRSRSMSPSMRDKTTGYSTSITHDANSSLSSHDEISPDNDILTDRAGFADELAENIRKMHNSRDQLNLPPTVNERMTDDTLEDSHAFSEVQVPRTRSSNASLVSGVSSVANEGVLEPCVEGEEDDDSDYSDDDDDTGGDGGDGQRKGRKKNHPTVILTNMENLNLHHQQIVEEDDDGIYDDDDDDENNNNSEAAVQRAGEGSTIGDGDIGNETNGPNL